MADTFVSAIFQQKSPVSNLTKMRSVEGQLLHQEHQQRDKKEQTVPNSNFFRRSEKFVNPNFPHPSKV